MPLYICLKFNNQNNDTMKNYKSTLDLLKRLQATMLLEQETALPFGTEFDELVDATKKLSAVIDYIQEKTTN